MDKYNINLLLKMKKMNQKYIYFFNEITNFAKNIEECQEEEEYKELKYIYNHYSLLKNIYKHSFVDDDEVYMNIEKLERKICLFKKINDIINKQIINTCQHEFIEDYIDIFPDKSKKIVYCKFCENNFDVCYKNK